VKFFAWQRHASESNRSRAAFIFAVARVRVELILHVHWVDHEDVIMNICGVIPEL